MPRVTHVKKAQPRYKTVPVIDEATGQPKRTPVMRRNGTQKTTKTGRPVFMTVTVQDKSQPLPLRTCDHCNKPIEIGTAYKHITPKSGPYGGHQRNRHAGCPTWNVWEYSNSLSARTAQISHDFSEEIGSADSEDAVRGALENAANAIREIAEEKREGANNIEEGFGHPTSQSDELNDVADQLDSWADEVESADFPEFPEPEEIDCEECEGSGEVETECETCSGTGQAMDESTCPICGGDGHVEGPCEACDGAGQITPDEPTDEQIEDWRSEVADALSIVDECPV